MRKLRLELRRRLWVLVVAGALGLAAGWLLSHALESNGTDEALLVVSVEGKLAEQPDASTRLASTYTKLIPADRQIEKAVESAVGGTDDWSIAATNVPNTAVLGLTVTARDDRMAEEATVAAVRAITGPYPASSNVQPGSVALIGYESAEATGESTWELAAIGLGLGLMIGAVLVTTWRRQDARVDTVAELREAVAFPCFEVGLEPLSARSLPPLASAGPLAGAVRLLVVPCRHADGAAAAAVAAALEEPMIGRSIEVVEGPAAPLEPPTGRGDATVLVVTGGTRARVVGDAVSSLGSRGVVPDLALFAGGHALRQVNDVLHPV